MDLRGLAALFGKINSLLSAEEPAETDGRDLFGLSRFLRHRGETPRAEKICAKAIETGLPAEHRQQASRDLALMAKRRGDYAAAAELWKKLASGKPERSRSLRTIGDSFPNAARKTSSLPPSMSG